MATFMTRQKPLPIANRVNIFFFILLLSLSAADGPQSGSDIFWPIVTLISIPLWEWTSDRRNATATEITLWMMALGSIIASTVFSWSPGFSVSSFIRLLTGFIWMKRFSSLTRREYAEFPTILSVFTICATILSAVPLMIPQLRQALPAFTLIGTPSGHLPIVYITLPLLAVILFSPQPRRSFIIRFGIGAAIMSIYISFSRTALFLSAAIFGISMYTKRQKKIPTALAAGLMVLALSTLAGLYWITTLPERQLQNLPLPAALRVYMVKNTLSTDPRLAFIREGVTALRTSPYFGTGPGTFSLVSKQFARSQNEVSDYAHNVWLEMLTEVGLIGTISFLWLTGYYVMRYRMITKNDSEKRSTSSDRTGYLIGIILLLGFGTVQSSFHHYPVWIIFMCLVGLTTVSFSEHRIAQRVSRITVTTIILCLYALSWIGSDLATVFRHPTMALTLAPYREIKALQRIGANTSISASARARILTMHPHSARVDIALADKTNEFMDWEQWFTKAIHAYPSDTSMQTAYLSRIARTAGPDVTCTAIRTLTQSPELPCMDETVINILRSPKFLDLVPLWNGPGGSSKFLYAVGLSLLNDQKETLSAITFWARARDLAPQWGYFHLELASLVAQYNGTTNAAVPTLLSCLNYNETRVQCQGYLNDLSELPRPGSWSTSIMAIPERLDLR